MSKLISAISLLAIGTVHLLMAPYTKVEESFNVQACHDLFYHGLQHLNAFDHLQFPGVVPRTFLGAIVISIITAPVKVTIAALKLPKAHVQIATRFVLMLLVALSFGKLGQSTHRKFGQTTAYFFVILTSLQFHIPFYISRPLPNVLAMALTNTGLAYWLEGKSVKALRWLTVAALVFRCDMVLLLGLIGIQILLTRRITLFQGVVSCAVAGVIGLASSVFVDSWFWQRWLWPEGEVLFFNTVLNKSHEWGVSPYYWYFTSALPRALHLAYPLAFLGALLDRQVRGSTFAVAFSFVALYSYLPHKEVRFLFPILPLWNISAAVAAANIWQYRRKSLLQQILWIGLLAGLSVSCCLTTISAIASSRNYPGGVALEMLHSIEAHQAEKALQQQQTLTVHIDTLPAMTGVSLFIDAGRPWAYSKLENLTDYVSHKFEYLLNAAESIHGYKVIGVAEGFSHMSLAAQSPLKVLESLRQWKSPIVFHMKPMVYIHKLIEE